MPSSEALSWRSFLNIARMPSITWLARWLESDMRFKAAWTSLRLGGFFASQRKLALLPKAIDANGWAISWTIDAAICPAVVKPVIRAGSVCIARNLSCARLLSVISTIVPINISSLDPGARATALCPTSLCRLYDGIVSQ